MKTKIQNIFIYNLSFFSILYIFLFIFYPENSSYFECNEVSKINNLGVVFNIPVSCDLDLYFIYFRAPTFARRSALLLTGINS